MIAIGIIAIVLTVIIVAYFLTDSDVDTQIPDNDK